MHPIARYRGGKGWTQKDLAERVGVSMNSIQEWEKGNGPRARNLPKLAEVLGVESQKLFDELDAWRVSQAKGE